MYIIWTCSQRVVLAVEKVMKPIILRTRVAIMPTLTLPIAMASQMFTIADVLEMCYYSDTVLSEDELSCNKGEEVYSSKRQRVSQPKVVAAFSRAVIFLPQLAFARMLILVRMRRIKENLKVSQDILKFSKHIYRLSFPEYCG